MQPEQKDCPYEFFVEETEEGYVIHLKGDKKKLKAKLDAFEAYHNCNHGFLKLVHKHIQAFHKHNRIGSKSRAAE